MLVAIEDALITGATGFVGRRVVNRLVARGNRVRVLVRPGTAGDPQKMCGLGDAGQVDVEVGDLTEVRALARAVHGADTVYHLALVYDRRARFSDETLAANLDITNRLVEACAAAGVRRVVYTSSVAVYGWGQPPAFWPIAEDAPLMGRSHYARTKIGGERLLRQGSDVYGFDLAVLRLANVYGPGAEEYERFLACLLAWPLACLAPGTVIDPRVERGGVSHWIHVDDATEAIVLAGIQDAARGGIFNVAGDEAMTRWELVTLVRRLAEGTEPGQPGRLGRPLRIYDITRARSVLGFRPRIGLDAGIGPMLVALEGRQWTAAPLYDRRASWKTPRDD